MDRCTPSLFSQMSLKGKIIMYTYLRRHFLVIRNLNKLPWTHGKGEITEREKWWIRLFCIEFIIMLYYFLPLFLKKIWFSLPSGLIVIFVLNNTEWNSIEDREIQCDPIWTNLNNCDPNYSNLIWFDPIWSNLILCEPTWTNLI